MKKALLATMAIVVAVITSACTTEPTHIRACAMKNGQVITKLEPDACTKGDDDYNRKAASFYVPNDSRWQVYDQLSVGEPVPNNWGSFTKPKGSGVNITDEVDD